MRVIIILMFTIFLAYGKTNIIYNDSQTAGICALAEAFEPTPVIFQGIIDLCYDPEIIIYCNTISCGVVPPTNASGVLAALSLSSKGLSGSIPTEIGLLTNLTTIDLRYNSISGTIPTQIGLLTSLTTLWLRENLLSGTIPREIGSLRNMKRLLLRGNSFSGTIPTEIGLMTNLTSLDCYLNELTGTIPSQMSNLILLSFLALGQNNYLTGTIPTQFGLLTSLTSFSLINDDINGTIPTELGNLKKLLSLDLADNNLSGTIPTELFNYPNITSFDLSFNKLSGTLPSHVGNLVNLYSLRMNVNQLSGEIPEEIGNLSKLNSLVLDNNAFISMPDSLVQLTKLTILNLYFNPISGTLPTGLSNLTGTNLEFKIFSTEISGTIPAQIGNWTNIAILDLSKNKLSGTIPTTIRNLTKLTFLSLDSNQLIGSIPTVSQSLRTLRLSNNYFTDMNCTNLFITGGIEGLFLAHNNITNFTCQGTSTNVINWPILYDLDISYNKIAGFPPVSTIASKLSRLKARGCGIKMKIYPFLQRVNYPGLNYLDASDNQLYDVFTDTIFTMVPAIDTLILANNNISGTLPNLDGWAFLSSLDISENNIGGPLPEYYPDVFQSLFLSNTKISGFIPDGLVSAHMNFLDLSNTSICVDNFPEEWEDKVWSACNFQFPWSCDAAHVPKHCFLSECVPTTKCFVNQCLEGHQCQNGRECIHNEKTWSYRCTECEGSFFQNQGLFACVPSYKLVLAILIPIFVVLVISMTIYYQTQLKKLNLFLPHNWLWEKSYIKKEGYSKSNSDPVYYLKEIDINGNNRSKEVLLFQYLKELLEFESIPIFRVIALSCITLAINLSHYRKITLQRMTASGNVFLNQTWKEKAPVDLRQKVRDSFQRQMISFDWNSNLSIENCPIMAVVHATSLNNAKKIMIGGFATLSFVDDGFYGKGMYFSSSASYVLPYGGKKDPCMLICFILPGNPFPVTEQPYGNDSLRGQKLTAGYQSHYVVTQKNGLPFVDKDYDNTRRYNEFIVDQEAQVVPIFLVELEKKVNDDDYNDEKSDLSERKNEIPIIDPNSDTPMSQ